MTELEPLDDRWHRLKFGIERSMIYHARREAFYSRWHRFNSFVSVLFGTGTIASLVDQSPKFVSIALAAVVTVFGAIDLVLGLAEKAKLHVDLRRRFSALEQCMVCAATEPELDRCWRERVAIEADEPPKMTALDVLCHNELAIAQGYDPSDPDDAPHFRDVGWFKTLTANLIMWEGAKFERLAPPKPPTGTSPVGAQAG